MLIGRTKGSVDVEEGNERSGRKGKSSGDKNLIVAEAGFVEESSSSSPEAQRGIFPGEGQTKAIGKIHLSSLPLPPLVRGPPRLEIKQVCKQHIGGDHKSGRQLGRVRDYCGHHILNSATSRSLEDHLDPVAEVTKQQKVDHSSIDFEDLEA